jgi:hypothetical protein
MSTPTKRSDSDFALNDFLKSVEDEERRKQRDLATLREVRGSFSFSGKGSLQRADSIGSTNTGQWPSSTHGSVADEDRLPGASMGTGTDGDVPADDDGDDDVDVRETLFSNIPPAFHDDVAFQRVIITDPQVTLLSCRPFPSGCDVPMTPRLPCLLRRAWTRTRRTRGCD